MVVDTSAVIAWLRNEPEADWIEERLERAAEVRMSAFNAFECRVVLLRRVGAAAVGDLERFLTTARVIIEPFEGEQAVLAFDAYRRFGKGTGHRAQLNLGDCAAYAVAKWRNLPLLFKGDDFSKTDVAVVR